MKIKILADNVINKIAAGEVVERPASVVRELVENSIDAGASEISVFLEQGGQSLLRVLDNGCGMEKADALLALERHATSKIESGEDLFNIRTLGFRGEALPSIAAVSRLRLSSRPPDREAGTEIVVNGGTIVSVSPCSLPVGTQIEVRSLFFNMPARRKFLRSVKYEELRTKEWLVATALSKPGIRFRLFSDGREIVSLAPRESIGERAKEIVRGTTMPIAADVGAGAHRVKVEGLVAHPSEARADTGGFHLLVNGRVIHDRMLLRAVREGFLTTLKDREFPVGFLALTVDPEVVDVNVHPQKSEVRFREGRALFMVTKECVARAVREFKAPLLTGQTTANSYQPLKYGAGALAGDSSSVISGAALSSAETWPIGYHQPMFSAQPQPLALRDRGEVPFVFSELRYLCQALDCFLVCQHEDALVLVDMHAAHERVNYNLIRQALLAREMPSQTLLLPERISLSESGLRRIDEEREIIERCGIAFDFDGQETLLLRSVPTGFRLDARQLIREIAASLPEEGASGRLEETYDHIAARLACHASIRSGESLTREEVYELFSALDEAELSGACPHGRPVVARFERASVESWFGRDR